jgi:hypothetical protein
MRTLIHVCGMFPGIHSVNIGEAGVSESCLHACSNRVDIIDNVDTIVL